MKRPDPITQGLWFGTLAAMFLIPYLAIPISYQYNTAKGIGWTGNLAVFASFFFALSIRGFSKVDAPATVKWTMLGIFAFIIYAVVGLRFGFNNFILSGLGILGILGGYGAGLGAYTLARTGANPFGFAWRWMLIGSIPLLVLPLMVYLTIDDYTLRQWQLKLYGFGNPRSLGHIISITIVILIGLSVAVLRPASKRSQVGWLVAHFAGLTLAWSLLMWSGSRAGVVAIVIGMGLACLVLWRLKVNELIYNLLAGAMGSALSLLYTVPHHSYSVLGRFVGMSETLSKAVEDTPEAIDATVNSLSSGRIELWSWAVEKIMEKPLTGWSYLPMRRLMTFDPENTPPVAHTHNIVLEYALGFGLPVAVVVFAVVAVLWGKALLATRRNPTAVNLVAFYLASILPIYSLMSAVLISPFQLALFGICIGGLLGSESWRRRVEAGDIPGDDIPREHQPDGVADDAIFV